MSCAEMANRLVLYCLGIVAAGCVSVRVPLDSDRSKEEATSFSTISISELRNNPDPHRGVVFDERFTFARIWWQHDEARPGEQSLDLPSHFTARVARDPLYIARIEFAPEDAEAVRALAAGTNIRARVRFLRLHAPGRSPVFELIELSGIEDEAAPSSILR